jgi:hypothetical protein
MTDNTLERNMKKPSFSKAISKRPAIAPKLNRNFVKTQASHFSQPVRKLFETDLPKRKVYNNWWKATPTWFKNSSNPDNEVWALEKL